MTSAGGPAKGSGGDGGGSGTGGRPVRAGSRLPGDPEAVVEEVLRRSGTEPLGVSIVSDLAGISPEEAKRIVAGFVRAGRVVAAGEPGRYLHRDGLVAAARRARTGLEEFHRVLPDRPGIEPAALRVMTEVIPEVFAVALATLRAEGRIVEENGLIRLAEFRPRPE